MKKLLLCSAASFVFGTVATAAPIIEYNFNSIVSDNSTTTGSLAASTGAGTAALLNTTGGGTSGAQFAGGSTRDPAPSTDNTAVTATGFPAATVGSGTAGFAFTGMDLSGISSDISITFDIRASNTGSKYVKVLTSTDGTTFGYDAGTVTVPTSFSYVTLTVPQAQAQSSTFAFRIVSVFDPANNTSYTAANTGSNYGTAGTIRLDMVQIDSPPVPEPATFSIAALGLAGGLLRRRRR